MESGTLAKLSLEGVRIVDLTTVVMGPLATRMLADMGAAVERLGFDEKPVRAIRPDIIYCIANGFGSDGPNADHAVYDDVIQAASGLASIFA